MLHAGVTDRRSWAPLVDHLGGRARCVGFDRRGYGETEYQPEDGWSPVADALAVLNDANIGSAVVVGSSIGGGTAIELALAHPDRVSSLVLITPAISGAPEPPLDPEAADLDAEIDAADEHEDLDAVNRLEAHFWLDGAGHDGRVSGPARDLFLEMNGRALRSADPGEQPDPPDAWSQLHLITVPTLFLAGSLDLRHFRDNARTAAASVRDGRFAELPDSAHVPHLEGDARGLRTIAEFIDSLP